LIDNAVVSLNDTCCQGATSNIFGNFRTSDRAWFALLDYAKRYDIKLTNMHFLANPFNGGDEHLGN
jgi:hypothetical protein